MSPRLPIPGFILTAWRLHHLPPDYGDVLRAFDAASIKVLDGDNPYHLRDAHEFYREAERAELARHGWGYHYIRTHLDARREGRAAGRAAVELGLDAYWLDAEKHWAGIAGEPRTENPERAALSFIETFRSEAPDCLLLWNGYSWPRWRGRPLTTDRILEACDGFAPQLYGTRARTIRRKWRSRVRRVPAGSLWAPMTGSGRIDSRRRVWGFHKDLPALVQQTEPEFLAFYFGHGASSMLLQGNGRNRAVVDVVRELRKGT